MKIIKKNNTEFNLGLNIYSEGKVEFDLIFICFKYELFMGYYIFNIKIGIPLYKGIIVGFHFKRNIKT